MDYHTNVKIPISSAYGLDLLLALVVAAIVVTIHGPVVTQGLAVGDEGYLVQGIQRLLEGEVLYRDFDRNYMPGVYYTFVPLFHWFGSDLLITRFVWLVWLSLLCAGSYLLLRPHVPRRFAALAALLVALASAPIHKTFVPATVVAGLFCCRALLATRVSFLRALAVGLVLGLASLFRQETAAFSVAIAAGTLLFKNLPSRRLRQLRAQAGGLAVGIVLVWLPVAIPLAVSGAFGPMFKQVVLSASAVNAVLALPYPSPFDRWSALPFYFPSVLAVLGIGLSVGAWVRNRFRILDALVLQWAAASVLLHTVVMQRSDSAHLRQMLVPSTLILIVVLARAWRGSWDSEARPSARRTARVGLVAATVAVLGLARWGIAETVEPAYRGMGEAVLLNESRARVSVGPELAGEVNQLLALIREHTREGDPIFIAPYGAIYYFIGGRSNPTRQDLVFPGYSSTDEKQRELRDRLEQARVQLVLIWNVDFDGREEFRFLSYATVLDEYLENRFRRVPVVGEWELFVRREPGLEQFDQLELE